MADKEIKCPCYIDRPLHRYDKGCLIQSQVFSEQQTQEKPILRCDEIKNCPIKEHFKQLKRAEQNAKDTYEMWQACIESLNIIRQELSNTEQKLEKIKDNCNKTLSECSCKDPIIDVDCRECTSGGRVEKAKEILKIIEGDKNE